MKIFRIENNLNNNFKSNKTSSNSMKKYLDFKEALYLDIDKYIAQKMSKEEFLKAFNNKVDKLSSNQALFANLTFDEKLFISDIKTTIDLADSIKSISDTELSSIINELLKNKNKLS